MNLCLKFRAGPIGISHGTLYTNLGAYVEMLVPHKINYLTMILVFHPPQVKQ